MDGFGFWKKIILFSSHLSHKTENGALLQRRFPLSRAGNPAQLE
jgi:hypothetical protein